MRKHKILILLICLCITATLNSQTPSKVVPKKNTDTVNKKSLLVFPIIANSIETKLMLGVAGSFTFHLSKSDTNTRTSNIQSLVAYTLNKQFIAAINGAEYFNKEKYILNHQLSYSAFPDKFWGIGNNSPDSAEENYNYHQYYIYLHLMRHLGDNLYLGALYELQNVYNVEYTHGGIFDKEDIAGRYGYLASGLGISFTYDTRNDAFAPNKGWFAQAYFNHFDKLLGSKYNYTNYVVDIRTFLSIYKKQVLALQAYWFITDGKEIPFRSLATFGGYNSMRGYYDGRYRDNNQYVFQAEYRFPIYKRIGAVVFADCGDVSHTISGISLNTLKYSYGGGLRFQLSKKEKLNLRLDYGIGTHNNSGFYLQLSEAF
ncbi:MAG: BamA/TamA family outer membrane protein [Bacteroidetes bacterium]|nr:BamA/TamA family outer membrane protein [Bacteroidota bacterium]MBS1650148.1 BamA/TamA family outer membrane protein [Bacteroidota bacterium]